METGAYYPGDVLAFFAGKPEEQELILTGRSPADWMREAADYCTEMHCWRHPYEKGIAARKGVEF